MKIYKNGHTNFFYIAMFFMFLTLLFLYGGLLYPAVSGILPFIDYGGVFRWGTFQIGETTISLYWSAYILGILLMFAVSCSRRKQYLMNRLNVLVTVIILTAVSFSGAKALYVLENLSAILSGKIRSGWSGVSMFGAVFMVPMLLPFVGRILRTGAFRYLDFCTPACIIMLTSTRLGCFMHGCCHGITVWIGKNPVILPTQLAEITLDLFLMDYILRLEAAEEYNNGRYFVAIGIYGVIRFFMEFIRETEKNRWIFSNGQLFSLVCIVIMIIYLMIVRKKSEKGC